MSVAIVGAGYAGLAAAITLCDAGIPITLFEAARHAGGRARSVQLAGHPLDNGQHLLLGAYHQSLSLMEKVAPGSGTRWLRREPLHIEREQAFHLHAPRLPAPAHLALALLLARGLSWTERLAALRLALRLRQAKFRVPMAQTVEELLAAQPPRVVRELWEPLCLAALNTPVNQASAQVFVNVIEASFARRRADSDFLLPAIDLGQLFPEPALRFLGARGVGIELATPVRNLVRDATGWRFDAAQQSRNFSEIILAVGPHQLGSFAAASPALASIAEANGRRGFLPIHTIYFQFRQARLRRAILALDGAPGQWLIDRGQLGGPVGLFAMVISATPPELADSAPKLEALARAQLRRAQLGLGEPLWARVLAERRATYRCLPDQPPPALEPAPGLFLAGDYCYPHFPATLEAAVRSGQAAATALLARR